mgnify:CR=1 FL=1
MNTDNWRKQETVLPTRLVTTIEDVFHGFLGILFLAIAILSTYEGIKRFFDLRPFYPNGVIQGVNDLLFVIILLEILRTIIGRFSDGVFQLESFLIIGVIASVRNILSVGATLALRNEIDDAAFRRQIIELLVSAGVALILVACLWSSKSSKRKLS